MLFCFIRRLSLTEYKAICKLRQWKRLFIIAYLLYYGLASSLAENNSNLERWRTPGDLTAYLRRGLYMECTLGYAQFHVCSNKYFTKTISDREKPFRYSYSASLITYISLIKCRGRFFSYFNLVHPRLFL